MRDCAPTAEILKGLKEVHERLLPLVARLSELDEAVSGHIRPHILLSFQNLDWAENSLSRTIALIEKALLPNPDRPNGCATTF